MAWIALLCLELLMPDACLFHSIGHIRPGPGWRMDAHTHAHHELILVLVGGQQTRMQGEVHAVRCGDILFYPSGVPHEEWLVSRQRLESYCLAFAWKGADPEMPLRLRDRGGRVRVLLELLHDEQHLHPSPATAEACRTLLAAVLAQLVKLWRYPPDDLVARLRSFVRDRIDRPLRLEDLADAANLSKHHLVRKYKGLTGRTPMEDVRILRVEMARNLILSTSEPLKLIAPQVGLGDV